MTEGAGIEIPGNLAGLVLEMVGQIRLPRLNSRLSRLGSIIGLPLRGTAALCGSYHVTTSRVGS
jgi:hypothetical protein